MADIDWVVLWREARACAARFRSDFWHEDYVQVAATALSEHWDKPSRFRCTIARRRVIDAFRSCHGRRVRRVEASLEYELAENFTLKDRLIATEESPEIDHELVDSLWDDRQHRVIARGLLAGYKKEEIADMLGVSPSRVSQLLTMMRQSVNRPVRSV